MKPERKKPQHGDRPDLNTGQWMHQGQAREAGSLLSYLRAALGQAKPTAVRSLIAHKAVLVNQVPALRADLLLAPGDRVAVLSRKASKALSVLTAEGIRLAHEDNFLLVADKPAGLLTSAVPGTPENSLYSLLNRYLLLKNTSKHSRVFAVHRLDQRTSGLVLFAKSEAVREAFMAAWDQVRKEYLAVVEGRMEADAGTLTSYLVESEARKMLCGPPREGAKKAVLEYQVERFASDRSLLRVVLFTGRKNQIRAQLAETGHPVLGDAKYGCKQDPAKRLALHAHRLSFTHPETGGEMNFESQFPRELAKLVVG